jgi:glycosyltransferase involved in cell wall biosynthesis
MATWVGSGLKKIVVSAGSGERGTMTNGRRRLVRDTREIVDGAPTERRRHVRNQTQCTGSLHTDARVTVVIPAKNEAENLPEVFARLPAGLFEVILVDGFSTDGTVETARELWPEVRIVYQTAWGKGNALDCGFRAATGDIIVMLDADGSTDPAEIPRFVTALLTGAEFAKGSRFITGGGSEDNTRLRRHGNWVLTHIVNAMWGVHYTDLCYGYNAFWRRCHYDIQPDLAGFEIETLINVRAAKLGLKVMEVPSFESSRRHGTSNLSARRDGMRVLRTIISERIRPSA